VMTWRGYRKFVCLFVCSFFASLHVMATATAAAADKDLSDGYSSNEDSSSINCSDGNRHCVSDGELSDTEVDIWDSCGEDSDREAAIVREELNRMLNMRDIVQEGVECGLFSYSRLTFLDNWNRPIYASEEQFLDDFLPAIRLLGFEIVRVKTLNGLLHGLVEGGQAQYVNYNVYLIEEDPPIVKWYSDMEL